MIFGVLSEYQHFIYSTHFIRYHRIASFDSPRGYCLKSQMLNFSSVWLFLFILPISKVPLILILLHLQIKVGGRVTIEMCPLILKIGIVIAVLTLMHCHLALSQRNSMNNAG